MLGIVGVPDRYSMLMRNGPAVQAYIPTGGTPAALTANHINPTAPVSGQFGGELASLKLNVGFADAGLTGASGSIPLGDMVLHHLALSAVNGMTVREFMATCDEVIGGDMVAGLTPSDATAVAAELNASFLPGPAFFGPSAWAQAYLRRPA